MRSLADFIEKQTTNSNNSDIYTPSYQSYLMLFGVYLFLRFPNVTNLDEIDTGEVENTALFCIGASRIAFSVWNRENIGRSTSVSTPQRRAA